ncbi:methyltransferase domain-containing protein [uncultured Thiothrix sp.]|mgnify:CR=1 FL=1|jgi:SAM-dependent methyltransferase|uniref:methyltransferase domain-containing protein n=1 Tax=uncultured Thiothrix sp. TaxID=223185 RepID=UPI002636048C|nr:methyltransferase domain-containing protein [uncultured Thiothrix sp.]HMT92628.1 methyltransferase domain-containing protein [Thiolinea sp.]
MKLSAQKIIRLSKRYAMLASPLKTKQCCLCGHKVAGFLAHAGGWKKAPQLMTALKMVGSDIDHFACPVCYSHDRERHQWLYWQAAGLLPRMHGAHILHFAPEQHLAQRVAAQQPATYIKADLYPNAADIQKVDLLQMPFTDDQFNFLIANHVMEHVANVSQALAEIWRVLKPGGWAILQTPYCATLQHTWEDAGIQSTTQRLAAYGQEDHVRLFGQDIFTRIEAIGFSSLVTTHNELLPNTSSKKYGVNLNEPFMLFRK